MSVTISGENKPPKFQARGGYDRYMGRVYLGLAIVSTATSLYLAKTTNDAIHLPREKAVIIDRNPVDGSLTTEVKSAALDLKTTYHLLGEWLVRCRRGALDSIDENQCRALLSQPESATVSVAIKAWNQDVADKHWTSIKPYLHEVSGKDLDYVIEWDEVLSAPSRATEHYDWRARVHIGYKPDNEVLHTDGQLNPNGMIVRDVSLIPLERLP